MREEEPNPQIRRLIEEGGKLLCEANSIIRGLDPHDRLRAKVPHQWTTRAGTPEEFYLACLLHDLTCIVAQTAQNAKLEYERNRHPMKEFGPLWSVLEEPLRDILAGVSLLMVGVFDFVGKPSSLCAATRSLGEAAGSSRAVERAFPTARGSSKLLV